MPIYDYQCSSCEHKLEAIQKISDAPLTTCPVCGKETLSKCVTAPSFRLGGNGWYETDFKTNNKKNLSESDSKETTPKKSEGASCCAAGSCK